MLLTVLGGFREPKRGFPAVWWRGGGAEVENVQVRQMRPWRGGTVREVLDAYERRAREERGVWRLRSSIARSFSPSTSYFHGSKRGSSSFTFVNVHTQLESLSRPIEQVEEKKEAGEGEEERPDLGRKTNKKGKKPNRGRERMIIKFLPVPTFPGPHSGA